MLITSMQMLGRTRNNKLLTGNSDFLGYTVPSGI